MTFVVITHQMPGQTSLLPELLKKVTAMPVVEARDGTRIAPDHVYIAPADGHLEVFAGVLHKLDDVVVEAHRMPIDSFFRSLADDRGDGAIGIILSGTGTDGVVGVRAIKGVLGMTMAQEPASAKYAGMPANAIATGLVDYVVSPAAMPSQLMAYVQGPYLNRSRSSPGHRAIDSGMLQKIYLLIRRQTGHDFSSYKSSTIRRRIERRMNVHQIDSAADYVRYLQESPEETETLFKDMLIGVTSFFRDPEAWEAFTEALEPMVATHPEGVPFRAWVAGCSTGEEAYSFAIIIDELQERTRRRFDVQIFATDLDAEAIDFARAGRYPDGIAADVSPERLNRHFISDDNGFLVRKELRGKIVFAPQNVLQDPPFTNLNVVTCRNLLIYLSASLQRKLLPIFHYAIKPGGMLFLGPSETIGDFSHLFALCDRRWKIFRRKDSGLLPGSPPGIPIQLVERKPVPSVVAVERSPRETRFPAMITQVLMERFVPVAIVISERGDIVYIHGRSGQYLEPAQGQPDLNILAMARSGLRTALVSAMHQCIATGLHAERDGVRVHSDTQDITVSLTVEPLSGDENLKGLLLVVLRQVQASELEPLGGPSSETPGDVIDRSQVKQLECDLQNMQYSYQQALQQLEDSNAELTSTNEELQSTNEELQSTNEELETSKEELQSLNEELATVNGELQTKLDDWGRANEDMQNLLNNMGVATVFLDNEFHVRRFTEQATQLVMLRATDLGRPLGELVSQLDSDDLMTLCREVRDTCTPQEKEVRTKAGTPYQMRVLPYRTTNGDFDGVVVTFISLQQVRHVETPTES